ncbi:DUF4365 domain-containing protein [Thalassomonas sp. RHCl1]|uniref:DUF4365 domain-containing protein n=1 Tax=Thalassomonas sp. RHCl1 TaxID=2995320 RepID=UPI00248B9C0A|nr:DUF4365 domain-containing protein [Thalassomonas sp. RHCl1]
MNTTPVRPRNHVIGDVGQTSVSLQLQKWGWTSEIITADYGEDLSCEIFVNGKRTAFHFRCQVKSFHSHKGQVRVLKNGNLSVSIAASTCLTWANSYYPVILAVYDEANDATFWDDVTEQVRKKIKGLTSKTTSFHIKKNELSKTRKQLESCVNRFYSKLLSVVEPEFTCNIFPVVMPQHRTISFNEISELVNLRSLHGISIDFHHQSYEYLPSWITAIKSTSDNYLYGLKATSSVESVEEYFANLKKVIAKLELPLKKGEWLSFIISPVSFKEKSENNRKGDTPWSKQLTDWECFSIIAGSCILDSEFSFTVPNDFKQQIARHSRSWDGFYCVSPSLDIAVQIYSMQATTPAFRESSKRFKQQILGKFVPWTCQKKDVESLHQKLNEIGLVYKEIPPEIVSESPNWTNGIITVPIFNPEIGLIPQTDSWEEFDEGEVKFLLKKKNVLDKLNGKLGSDDITTFILSFFNEFNRGISQELSVLESDYILGMPLYHNKREVLFHKLFFNQDQEVKNYTHIENNLKSKLVRLLGNDCTKSDIHVDTINSGLEPILGITAVFSPSLETSSHDFIEKYKIDISALFDLHDKAKGGVFENSETKNILKYHGELYFEGDSPWGIKKVKN